MEERIHVKQDNQRAMRVSIVIPFHWMKDWQFFLTRCLESIESQTFTDYEVILMKVGNMPTTTNRVMEGAQCELVKVLYMDDYFTHENSLKEMVDAFGDSTWMITGTNNNPNPYCTDDIETGNNKLGSPSALMYHNSCVQRFDERLSWLLDCDYYKKMERNFGKPKILNGNFITLGTGDHQMTNILTDEEKRSEHYLLKEKYGNN